MSENLTLPIQFGKEYVCRDGEVVSITSRGPHLAGFTHSGKNEVVFLSTGRGRNGYEARFDLVADYTKPAKGHPHAALMTEYAKDAAENREPWKLWQCMAHDDDKWFPLTGTPLWSAQSQYRRKPRTIMVNGHEVPEPMRVAPENGSEYWTLNLMGEYLAYKYSWDNYAFDNLMLSRGQAHSTEEAAQAHARALLSFTNSEQKSVDKLQSFE